MFLKSISVLWTQFCDSSNRLLGSLLVMFLRATGLDVGRLEPVLFIFNRQNKLCEWALSFYQLQKLSPFLCDKMVWIALLTKHRESGAWTSPLLPSGVPSVILLVRIGQSRRWHNTVWHQPVSWNNCFNSLHLQRAQVTDSQKPTSTVMRVCHPYSIMWTILDAWE